MLERAVEAVATGVIVGMVFWGLATVAGFVVSHIIGAPF